MAVNTNSSNSAKLTAWKRKIEYLFRYQDQKHYGNDIMLWHRTNKYSGSSGWFVTFQYQWTNLTHTSNFLNIQAIFRSSIIFSVTKDTLTLGLVALYHAEAWLSVLPSPPAGLYSPCSGPVAGCYCTRVWAHACAAVPCQSTPIPTKNGPRMCTVVSVLTAVFAKLRDYERRQKQSGRNPKSYITLCCLQGSLLEGRSAQFMCIINTSTPSAPCGLSSRQPGKPNFSLKAGVLCLGLVVSQEKTIVTTLQKRFFDLLWSTDTSHTSSLAWKQHMLRLCPSLEEEKVICGKGKQRRIVCQPVEMCFFMREQSISD